MKSRKLILKVLLSVALLILALNLSCLTLAAGGFHTVGIEPDGTVVAVGRNDEGQCNVGSWTDISQVAAGFSHTVGIEVVVSEETGYGESGTVDAVGRNDEGQCNVGDWTDIVMVVAGGWHTVGLEAGGTVVATGRNDDEQCDVSTWMDITQVAAGYQHTVGLQSGGIVVATGRNDEGQCNVDSWTDIVQVAAGGFHTVGRHSDGTVVAEGKNDEGQCNVGGWTDIGLVVAGYAHTVGIREDGSVVATGRNDEGQCNVGSWRDIVWVGAGGWHTVGLKDNGRVVATGDNNYGQCDVDDWILLVPGDGEPPEIYYLTISSTAGGSVTTPGEGTFTYDAGTEVSLVATKASGYGFVNWAGDVDTIANVNAATTTITMNDDYVITARFMAGVVDAKTERVKNDTIDATEEADTEVWVTGTATVTAARYEDNPGGDAPIDFNALDKYIDVYVPDTAEATELEIRLYYTDAELAKADIDEESLRLFWLHGEEWVPVSPDAASGVNTTDITIDNIKYSGYMWAEITATTTPSLENLQGTSWGGYGHPTEVDGVCGCFIATAAYGTDTAKEIDILREFRDAVLLPNSLGAEFVSFYYKTSPPIANFISQHEVLRKAVRVGFVDPIVKILNWSHALWFARGS